MSGLRQRAIEYFVAPGSPVNSGRRAREVSRAALESPTVGVLGALEAVPPVAALVSAEVRTRSGGSCVLIADWCAGERMESRAGVASRRARQLAGSLGGRDLDAQAHGRSVTLHLPEEPEAARSAWRRALAAADCPSVCALAGPRPAGLEPLLGQLDLIVLVVGGAASDELSELALAGLAGARALVVRGRPVSSGIARMVASSSVATSRLLGAEVTQAVRALA